MKRPTLWFTLVLVATVTAAGVFILRSYVARPFFALDFRVLLGWIPCRPISLDDDTYAYFDRHQRVLLVVPQKTTRDSRHQIQWVIERAPVSDCLRIHETEDETIREIEWRRDCVIIVNGQGVPTYTSMSVREFRDAFSTPGQLKSRIEDIVRRARAGQTERQPATSGPAQQ